MVSVIAYRMGVDAEQDPRPQVVAEAIGAAIMVGLQRWHASEGGVERKRFLIEALDILEAIGAARGRPDTSGQLK
jgi:hypothetical protein